MTIMAKGMVALLLAGWCFTIPGNARLDDGKDQGCALSAPVDTLQSLLDEYSHQVAVRTGCTKKIDNLSSTLDEIEGKQKGLTEEKRVYQKKIDDLDKLTARERKADSIRSLRRKYDSLIDDIVIRTIGNDKIREKHEQERKRAKDSLQLVEAVIVQKLKGVREAAGRLSGAKSVMIDNRKYQLFVADTARHTIRLHLFKKDGKNYFTLGAVLSSLAGEKQEPQMITNAGMFTPAFEPEGLFVDGHSTKWFTLDTGSHNTGNFYLKPNGVFYMDSTGMLHVEPTDKFIAHHKPGMPRVKMATQSGPMLVIDGKIHPAFNPSSANLNIRSGVGAVAGNRVVFILALDPVNFYDFASIFKDLFNCQDALFLDGAISQMYLRDLAPRVTGGRFGPIISVSKK